MQITRRLRRNRRTETIRSLVQETHLHVQHLVWPVFLMDGKNRQEPIATLPGVYRWSLDLLLQEIPKALSLGVQTLALFPFVDRQLKDPRGRESLNKNSFLIKAIQNLKDKFPDVCLITDIALDPFTSHGHDGLVENGEILNDPTVEILSQMAVLHGQAGADYVAPSDMMDGRVGTIRQHLDRAGLTQTGILAYSAKYASAYYGPFREAVGSHLEFGDKRTYQMNPANVREALTETSLDLAEGADIIMVKPALAYLDVIAKLRQKFFVPIAAYNVSGEYAMIKACAEKGWLCEQDVVLETLTSLRRAGADLIFTYHAIECAKWLATTQ